RLKVDDEKSRLARALGVAAVLVLAAGCGGGDGQGAGGDDAALAAASRAFQAEEQKWRDQRLEELLRPDGWTSLVGLHWLELKAHYIGSGERIGNTMRMAFRPARMGLVTRD